MIKIETFGVYGLNHALRAMRNPYDSWAKSDSAFSRDDILIGESDAKLANRLIQAGSEHCKFLRMIVCYANITAPLYWWKQFDTYRIGVEKSSCSSMHRIMAKPFTLQDFSFDTLYDEKTEDKYFDVQADFPEEWRDVQEMPGYRVSNQGNVWSSITGQMLKPCVNSSNYKKVKLRDKQFYVHRLVASAFRENPGDLPEVNHIDGNKWNNNYTNLEWVSKSENAKHAVKLGLRTVSGFTRRRVAKSSRRFTDDEVEQIHAMYESGMLKQEIADHLGCSESIICNILNGVSYREVEMTPMDWAKLTVSNLNDLRDIYLESHDRNAWMNVIAMLPESYNQTRTVMMSYQAIRAMCHQRKGHRLTEWHDFIAWAKTLPESWMLVND